MKNFLLARFFSKTLPTILLVVSFYFYYRGHNLPGGGFVAGLVASTAYVFRFIVNPDIKLKVLWLHPAKLAALGLFLALCSSMISFYVSGHFFQGIWTPSPILIIGKLGTPMLFDLGVLLSVLGMVTWIVVSTLEDKQ